MQPDKTILFATNDRNLRSHLIPIMEEKGFLTTVLNQGRDVVLTVLDREIDLLILDLDLDGMSGLEIIPIIRKTRPRIPIIVISGDNSLETGGKILHYGIFYYLLKPINVDEISEVLDYVPN